MALQTSGQITLNDIHLEAGGSSGAQASINDADIRGLISKGSGAQMAFSEWYGASNTFWEQPYTETFWTPSNGSAWKRTLAGDWDGWDSNYYSSTKTIDLQISSGSFNNAALSIATYFGNQAGKSFTLTGTLELPTFSKPRQYVIVRGYTSGFLSGSSSDYILELNTSSGSTAFSQSFTVNSAYKYLVVAFEVHAAWPGSDSSTRGQFIDFKLT